MISYLSKTEIVDLIKFGDFPEDPGIDIEQQCAEKFCSCDKACRISALLVISCSRYLEKRTIDDKYVNSTVYTLDTVRFENDVLRRKNIRCVMCNKFTFDQLKIEYFTPLGAYTE